MIGSWLAAHKSLVATATSGTAIVALVTTMAVVSSGYSAQRMNLGDAAVWVASGAKKSIGRANTEIDSLNTVVPATGSTLDVVQDGTNVLLVDSESNTVAVVDPATSEAGKSMPLPPRRPSVHLAGNRVAITSQTTGQVWLTTVGDLSNFNSGAAPTLDLGGAATTTMDASGVLYAFLPDTGVVHRIDTSGTDTVSTTERVPQAAQGVDDTITTVAGRWALLDPDRRVLYLHGRTVDLAPILGTSTDPVLQQPSTTGDSVAIATSTGLIRVPLDGSPPVLRVSGRSGLPAPPITVGGCTYAAWTGGSSWSACSDSAAGSTRALPQLPPGASLAFRANGPRVVLNDAKSGVAWAVQNGNAVIDNWDQLVQKKNNQEQVDQSKQDRPPQYAKAQQPPVAINDSFGARPGRVTPLPVLLNDYDPNGDVLVIDSFTGIPAQQGTVELVNSDQQLQITLPENATGRISFQYTISDGHGGSASATVTVTVRLPDENSPPVCTRTAKAVVQSGGRVTSQVLGNCYDPDGDAFFLASATVPAPDAVTFTPQGSVAYSDKGRGGTLKDVSLVVSDSRADGTGTLSVTVRSPGSVPIIADPFAVLAYQGQEVTISPLLHVRGGTGTVRLSNVPAKADSTITPDFQGGTFRFTSDQVGTHNLEYAVTDGVLTATGSIRIDVKAPPGAKTQPVAVPHTAFIREQTTQSVDVLATDFDPSGGVLLITAVTPPPAATGVRVEILGQRTLRVTLNRPLDVPVNFHYRISNGLAETEGTVTVVMLPPLTIHQPPIANPDTVSVRVGDVADIPVLANDVQPDGDKLTLDPTLASPLPAGAGLLFASGNQLRYLAPSKPGNFTAVYRVTGEDGQWATAEVSISVRERDAATNNPPVPKTATARVLSGDTVRITIPLSGIDPDGDSVQLIGQETNPQKGAVIASGPDWMDYQAGEYSAGTDTFTYAVVDALGARATGVIRVGIAPRIDGARNPVAVEDDVTVRPGKTLSIQVLANDSDPDGSPLSITKVTSLDGKATAKIVGSIVTVKAPKTEGVTSFFYTIQNERGGTSENFIRVTVSKDAPLARPVASDTVLGLSDILGKRTVSVNVLANVFFADGPVGSLKLSVVPGYGNNAEVTSGKRIRIAITAKSQIIPFRVAHPDDDKIAAYAFVRVPGYDDALPQLKRGAPKLSVPSEKQLTIHLNDYIVAVGNRKVRLTDAATVRATHANGDDLVVNNDTLQFTSEARYFGTASISFQVTDGSSDNDPNANVATIVLPITVTPRQNQPPVFTGALIDFEPGQSKTINLAKLTSYPYAKDQNELVYTVQEPKPAGVNLSLDGQKLTIAVDANTPKGAHPSISVGVKDAINAGQAGRIDLNVVPSTRPLASPAADRVIAPRGKTTTVDVLANDNATNPFPDKPLKVIGVRGLTSSNLPAGVTIAPSADKSTLSVTVSPTAAPVDTTLQYEVSDATGDPARYAWGTVTVSVQDRPAPVSNVQVTTFADRALTLSWIPGAYNNSPILGYDLTVTRADNGQVFGVTTCVSTTCTVPTPGNGPDNAVHITVAARNALGLSDPVPYTDAVWSDLVPTAPANVSTTPLDHGLRFTWTKPADASGASPITSYLLTLGSVTASLSVSGKDGVGTAYSLNLTDAGVSNGASVPISIASRNDFYAGRTTWNQTTGSGVPAGAPIATGAVPVASPSRSDGRSATFSWGGAFADNGRAIQSYFAGVYEGNNAPSCTVTGVENGQPVLTVDNLGPRFKQVDGSSVDFSGLSPNHTYSFIVYAYNGQGCTAAPVVQAVPRLAPGTPTDAQTSPPTDDGTGLFDFTLTGVTYRAGGGTNGSVVNYVLTGNGVNESGQLGLGGGVLAPAGTRHYGVSLTLHVQVCDLYPGSDPICSGTFQEPLGTPVSTQLSGARYDPVARTFSWTGWPTGAYDYVRFSCDGGATRTDMPAVGQTPTCTVTPIETNPTLIVYVGVPGVSTPYEHSWRSADLG
ncbi:tandem-95 repeat protein [Diaminobutyricibacter tongyongensis]|uniref:Tandem-95 repeat protein n=2 Tax=Leifsonia tongyongensis TaxID=1268043 RepID=A0A6L9Y166_9MICO|nr:tandem-95 repeat protein [Diaminobutyricibacter tongyongensis]